MSYYCFYIYICVHIIDRGKMKRMYVNTGLVKTITFVNNWDLLFRNVKSRDSF